MFFQNVRDILKERRAPQTRPSYYGLVWTGMNFPSVNVLIQKMEDGKGTTMNDERYLQAYNETDKSPSQDNIRVLEKLRRLPCKGGAKLTHIQIYKRRDRAIDISTAS